MHKVLVVSFAKKAANRAVYEDTLVSELKKHGVEAVASYTMISGATLPDWQVLDRAVRSTGSSGCPDRADHQG